jgi:hypothetical protein
MVTTTEDHYPDHDGGEFAPIEATTVATWRAPAFLENLAIDADGAVFVTVYSHNRVDRYDPATGATTTFAEVPAPPMGLAFDAGDFAFGISGSVYITTHPEHTLVRLNPSGARTTLAGPEEGMVGSTACAFGRAPGDENALYVTTDGGFLIPHESGIQDAKLVRLEVGESGWPLLQRV